MRYAATTLMLIGHAVLGHAPARAEPRPVPAAPNCAAKLGALGISVEAGTLPSQPPTAACGIVDPVRLSSVVDPAMPERRIAFPEKPLLACAMAERFARFSADIVAPLALGVYGKELASVATGPGYECRPRNRQSGAKPSSHGQGLAVDIAQIGLHGGVRVVVEKPGDAEAGRFLAGLRAAACGAFSTVLGPGSDAAHANHIHIDIEARGRDGRSKFCQ